MNTDSRSTLFAAFAGMVLFLLWGLDLIVNEVPHGWDAYVPLATSIHAYLFAALLFGVPVFLCVGWITGFPRWSYPYAAQTVVFSLYISNASTPGFEIFGYEMFGREPWGWRAWIPFMVIALIALAVTRSVKPIGKFFTNIWNDWTLLTYAMFGFMPLLVAIGFDEMDRLFSLYFMVIVAFVMAGAAWFYLRAGTQRGRVIVLLAGIGLTTAITVVAPTLYWQRNGWVNPAGMVLTGGAVILFMFGPALIGFGRYLLDLGKESHVTPH
jgi:hypothetical protein